MAIHLFEYGRVCVRNNIIYSEVNTVEYKVVYKSMAEIIDNYSVNEVPISENSVYECVIFENNCKLAKFIKLDVPNMYSKRKPLLQRSIRCYIISSNNVDCGPMALEILDRYG